MAFTANSYQVEGFSISHAAILDGTTAADKVDLYGVRGGSLSVDTGSYDNTGDDAVLSTWSWFNFGTLSIQGGYVPFKVLAELSGQSIMSSSGSGDYFALPLWNDTSLNQARKPVLIRVPSKDQDSNARNLDFVLYSVQFDPVSFDGPTYKDGLVINYGGKALMASKNEKGDTIAEKAIGKLVSRPTTGTTFYGPVS